MLDVILPNGTTIEYINDPLGRRIAKKVNGMIIEKYLWQGLTRLLAVYDSSNNILKHFEYADDQIPMAMTKGGVNYNLTYDQVGSLRIVADASGNVIKRIDYDSFGSIINDTNPGFQVPFGFAGGLYDQDTDLVRFGFRDYDPEIGRWTAKDPILFLGGDTDLYGYCLSDPINNIDPTGEQNPASKIAEKLLKFLLKKLAQKVAKGLYPEPYQDEDKWIKEHSGDTDGDGVPDYRDGDMDGDGIPNWEDPDTDGDGIPNDSDPDPDKPEDEYRNNQPCAR